MVRPLIEIVERGGARGFRFGFHAGQRQAWDSLKRFILVLAGTQSGKTTFGPPWLWREMRRRGPGDYLVVTPTFPLLIKKALPEFLRLLGRRGMRLGEYHVQKKVFEFSEEGHSRMFPGVPFADPTQVFFGHAQDPESLESATAKAVWMDEAGQKKFRLASWQAIQRRLSLNLGRALITTTPYDLGWLKQRLWDPWEAAGRDHPEIEVVRFDSTMNPSFPREEFERARRELPAWLFDLFYRAIFTRPAGLIYDCFDPVKHKVKRFALPEHWPRYVGLDFGLVNTAAVFLAGELNHANKPTGRLFAYREYRGGGFTMAEHILEIMKGEPRIPHCVGGSASEGGWRAEFAKGGDVRDDSVAGGRRRIHGLPVGPPSVTAVDVGINRVYSTFRRDELLVFDDLHGLLDELESYSYEVDEATGQPNPDKIEDKNAYHGLDALRYIVGYLKREATGLPHRVKMPGPLGQGLDLGKARQEPAPGARQPRYNQGMGPLGGGGMPR